MMHGNNNATRLFMMIGNNYEWLDNIHISVPEYNYQNDKYPYQFHCIIQTIIMYSYQI